MPCEPCTFGALVSTSIGCNVGGQNEEWHRYQGKFKSIFSGIQHKVFFLSQREREFIEHLLHCSLLNIFCVLPSTRNGGNVAEQLSFKEVFS